MYPLCTSTQASFFTTNTFEILHFQKRFEQIYCTGLTSAFGQHGLIETRFILLTETIKKKATYLKQCYSDIRQHKAMVPKRS